MTELHLVERLQGSPWEEQAERIANLYQTGGVVQEDQLGSAAMLLGQATVCGDISVNKLAIWFREHPYVEPVTPAARPKPTAEAKKSQSKKPLRRSKLA